MREPKCILQSRFVLNMLFGTNISFGNCARKSLSDDHSMAVFWAAITPFKITLQKSFSNRELMSAYLVIALHHWSQFKLATEKEDSFDLGLQR